MASRRRGSAPKLPRRPSHNPPLHLTATALPVILVAPTPAAAAGACWRSVSGGSQMRDRRFVAVHRGGPLDAAKHRLLAAWAADCAERLLPLFEECSPDDRPRRAVQTARAWVRGEASVGDCMKAAVGAHAAA